MTVTTTHFTLCSDCQHNYLFSIGGDHHYLPFCPSWWSSLLLILPFMMILTTSHFFPWWWPSPLTIFFLCGDHHHHLFVLGGGPHDHPFCPWWWLSPPPRGETTPVIVRCVGFGTPHGLLFYFEIRDTLFFGRPPMVMDLSWLTPMEYGRFDYWRREPRARYLAFATPVWCWDKKTWSRWVFRFFPLPSLRSL